MNVKCDCVNCGRVIELCAYWTPRGILCYECYVEQHAETLPPIAFEIAEAMLPCRLERTNEEMEQPNEHTNE